MSFFHHFDYVAEGGARYAAAVAGRHTAEARGICAIATAYPGATPGAYRRMALRDILRRTRQARTVYDGHGTPCGIHPIHGWRELDLHDVGICARRAYGGYGRYVRGME